MTYKQFFRGVEPFEEATFFKMYKFDNGTYVIHAEREREISCIEMYSFKSVSIQELSILFNKPIYNENKEEFIFEEFISRSDILKYLMDVTGKNKNHKIEYNIQPYFAYQLSGKSKQRFNLLNHYDNDVFFSFDDSTVWLSNEKFDEGNVFVTYDPMLYSQFINDGQTNQGSLIYLFGASCSFLNCYISDLKEKFITVHRGRENPVHSLELLVHLYSEREKKDIRIERNGKEIHCRLSKDIDDDDGVAFIMGLANTAQKVLKSDFTEDEQLNISMMYGTQFSKDYGYIIWKDVYKLSEAFLKVFYSLVFEQKIKDVKIK